MPLADIGHLNIAEITFEAMREVERDEAMKAKRAKKSKDKSFGLTGEDKKAAVIAVVKDKVGDEFGDVAAIIVGSFIDLIVGIDDGKLKLKDASSLFGCFSS